MSDSLHLADSLPLAEGDRRAACGATNKLGLAPRLAQSPRAFLVDKRLAKERRCEKCLAIARRRLGLGSAS